MKIFAMVTTKDSNEYTLPALESFLRRTTLSTEDQFYLIDNDFSFSNGNLPEALGAQLIQNPSPLGFAQNVNEMIEKALDQRADLFFLNNDVIFTEGWLDPLLEQSSSICTPLSNREVQYGVSVVVAKSSHVASTFLTRNPPMNLAEYSNNSAQLDAIVESHRSFSSGQYVVAVLPYYCVRIPLVVMESIGYFDTSFGNGGGEDFDYSLRAHLAGFDTHYALGSYMLHFGGKSTWAGETEQHNQADRQEQYHRVFREKWGENLYRFILQEDASILDQVKLSKETAGTGVARAIIKELKGDLEITLKIPRKPGSIH